MPLSTLWHGTARLRGAAGLMAASVLHQSAGEFENGLRGVNFPAPGATLPPFNDDVWEPFWSAAEDLDMTLTTHAGAGDPGRLQLLAARPR